MGVGEPPGSGVATFLFTDIEGSTWLVQHLGEAWDETLHDHYRLLRAAWEDHNGYEVSTEGDAFFVAFADATDAVRAALAAQRKLDAHEWRFESPLRVRIGIHTGDARSYDGDYVGLAVHQAARVKAAAHGGQVIVSEETKTAAGDAFAYSDLGLHRLKDLAQPVRLHEVLDAERPMAFPPPKTLTVMPNNFPVQSTTFVGRDDDIARVKELLGASRLVTLTGAGGVGKTRLALQVGAELIDEFADGVWLVDLAGLADPVGVPGQVADAIGIREQTGRDIRVTLTDNLINKQLMIALDNCEHVIDACADLAHRLLVSCSDVKVLATSREALNVAGEVPYRLRSLGVPEDEKPDLAVAAKTESVRLFAQRARAVDSSFDVTADNVGAIVQICRRLDGLPLAIELAAARTSVMSAQEIAERLDDRFRLLTGGSRVALPRQRTLEATVAWSYDLLPEDDRTVFDKLSVFAGGCTLVAAQAVCADETVNAFDVLDSVCKLADRSLVVAEPMNGATRYRMLETLRQFARDRLLSRGEVATTRDRHLAWVVQLAPTLPPQVSTHLPPEVAVESDNVRTAIEWAIESGDHASALAILADVWNVAVHPDQRARWYDVLLPSAEAMPTHVAARVIAAAGGLAFMMGDWKLAAERNRAAARSARAIGDHRILALALIYEGASLWGMGRDEDGLALVAEGRDIARANDDGEMIRRASMFMSWALAHKDLDAALAEAEANDRASRAEGSPFDKAHAREVLAYIDAERGDLARARTTLIEALPLFDDVLLSCTSHVLETAAAFAAMIGDFILGAELWAASDRLREETADKPRPWERAVQEVWLPKIREGLDAATFEDARAKGAAMDRDAAVAYAVAELTRRG